MTDFKGSQTRSHCGANDAIGQGPCSTHGIVDGDNCSFKPENNLKWVDGYFIKLQANLVLFRFARGVISAKKMG